MDNQKLDDMLLICGPSCGKSYLFGNRAPSTYYDTDAEHLLAEKLEYQSLFTGANSDNKTSRAFADARSFLSGTLAKIALMEGKMVVTNRRHPAFLAAIGLPFGTKLKRIYWRKDPVENATLMIDRHGDDIVAVHQMLHSIGIKFPKTLDRKKALSLLLPKVSRWITALSEEYRPYFQQIVWLEKGQFLSDVINTDDFDLSFTLKATQEQAVSGMSKQLLSDEWAEVISFRKKGRY